MPHVIRISIAYLNITAYLTTPFEDTNYYTFYKKFLRGKSDDEFKSECDEFKITHSSQTKHVDDEDVSYVMLLFKLTLAALNQSTKCYVRKRAKGMMEFVFCHTRRKSIHF